MYVQMYPLEQRTLNLASFNVQILFLEMYVRSTYFFR